MTNLTEFTFLSSDGKTRLHAMQWLPEGTPRAVLQISHGVAEHIGRYDGFARYLNEQGLAVVGHDHLGSSVNVLRPPWKQVWSRTISGLIQALALRKMSNTILTC